MESELSILLLSHTDHSNFTGGLCIGLEKTFDLFVQTNPHALLAKNKELMFQLCNLLCLQKRRFGFHIYASFHTVVPSLRDLFPGISRDGIYIADHLRDSFGCSAVIVKASQEPSNTSRPVFLRLPGKKITFLDLVIFSSSNLFPLPQVLLTDNNIWWYGSNGIASFFEAQQVARLLGITLSSHNFGISFDAQKKVERAVKVCKNLKQ